MGKSRFTYLSTLYFYFIFFIHHFLHRADPERATPGIRHVRYSPPHGKVTALFVAQGVEVNAPKLARCGSRPSPDYNLLRRLSVTHACWDCLVQYWDRVARAKTPRKSPGAFFLLFKYAHNTHLQQIPTNQRLMWLTATYKAKAYVAYGHLQSKGLCGLRQLLAQKNHSTVHSSKRSRSPLRLGLIRLHQAELVMVNMMHSLDEAVG